ncbi:hypothetical protein B0T17DRAFT_621078 [Bombardia bombarda]|uniref:Uncharacterized protein n=1 Tax=Bombardia bombarda TaxID=252184 RepID=A0AA39TGY9_9PEZI|nr:hypothetical protein B0T17DRAFT_621078 [Bombardia bombarda]
MADKSVEKASAPITLNDNEKEFLVIAMQCLAKDVVLNFDSKKVAALTGLAPRSAMNKIYALKGKLAALSEQNLGDSEGFPAPVSTPRGRKRPAPAAADKEGTPTKRGRPPKNSTTPAKVAGNARAGSSGGAPVDLEADVADDLKEEDAVKSTVAAPVADDGEV